MSSLVDLGIAPGRLVLRDKAEFEAYWSRCEAAIIEAMVAQLAGLETDEARADYFVAAFEYAAGLDDDARARRGSLIRRVRRRVYQALQDSSAQKTAESRQLELAP